MPLIVRAWGDAVWFFCADDMMKLALDGLLVIDKPAGMTSRAVVDCVQRWFKRGTKIGHTGTLDPIATGVLVLCIGSATRLAEFVQAMSKTYQAVVCLGARSDTDDADGDIRPTKNAASPELAQVEQCIRQFVGALEQIPPAYSAAKVGGNRAYRLARRGQDVPLAARTVQVHTIDL